MCVCVMCICVYQSVQHPIISYKILYVRTEFCKILYSSLIIPLSKDRSFKTSNILVF